MSEIVWQQRLTNYADTVDVTEPVVTEEIVIRHNVAGKGVRLTLSNEYGSEPVYVNSVTISQNIDEGIKIVTFNKSNQIDIAPQTSVASDVVDFHLDRNEPIYIRISFDDQQINTPNTGTRILSRGIVKTNLPNNYLHTLTGISVDNVDGPSSVLAFFGDSLINQGYLTDGLIHNAFDNRNKNLGIVNAGISGNRLLFDGPKDSHWGKTFGKAGYSRFDDVMKYHPATIFMLIGVNDLIQPGSNAPDNELPTVQEFTEIYQELIANRQADIIPLTIPPFERYINNGVHAWNLEKEELRRSINSWLIEKAHAIDINQLITEKTDNSKLLPQFDSGDHLHFSESGAPAIADFIWDAYQTGENDHCQAKL